MINPEQSVVAAILVCLGGALASLLVSKRKRLSGWVAFAAVCAASLLVFSGVIRVLRFGPSPLSTTFWSVPAWGVALRFRIDGLSALFLGIAAAIAVLASLYSIEYLQHYEHHGAAGYYPYLLVFLAALFGLVSTTDMMWFFLLFWQMMTLPGYALIRYERERPENARAAGRFLWMMEIACVTTLVGAEMLAIPDAPRGSIGSFRYDFYAVSEHLPLLIRSRPHSFALASTLFLVGFGIKAGMWPFGQVWLPDAHPAAPSPVSAMLSGVMIKTGVYGLMRYSLWLVPRTAAAEYPLSVWGAVIAVLGTVTLLSGTMQALRQEQSKRLLAFHSIGQIGYVLLGLGTCMALLGTHRPEFEPVAALALLGSLFHVLNHALFKSLLFFNAGSLLYSTGSQDLDRMGGLSRYMPFTAATALVGSLSIAGIPLLNGFASKWAIVVAGIRGSPAAPYLVLCAVLALLTSGLTLASFVKFYGASFLSRTSALVKARAEAGPLEVASSMQASQFLLASACVVIGLAPGLAMAALERVLDASRTGLGTTLADAALPSVLRFSGLEGLAGTAVFTPLALLVLLGILFLWVSALSLVGKGGRRTAEPWLCGYAYETELCRYSAHHWYAQLKRYFTWLGGTPRIGSSGTHPEGS